jgi:hypothetical protein
MFERDRGEDGVHDKRADSLPVTHKPAQDFQYRSPGSRIPAACWPSQEEIAASASDVESGRSDTRGFVAILRKTHSISQA